MPRSTTAPTTSITTATLSALATGLAFSLLPATASDWPGWRGADRSDHSPDTGLLGTWPSGGPERAWLYDEAGVGYSGPAVVGGTLFTLGIRGEVEEVAIAIDTATGDEKWSTTIGALYTNKWGDGPRSTPTYSEGLLYVLGAKGDLVCLDAATGDKEWERNLEDDFGGKVPGWGYTESPLVVGDLVVATPGGDDGTVIALDKKSGRRKWQSDDITDDAHYSSCITFEFGGRTQIAQLTEKHVFGLDARNGSLLWQHDWDGRVAVIPTPVYHEGHVYVTSGYGVGCMLVKLPERGKGDTEEVYKNNVMVNHHGGVVLVDGHIYGHSDDGGWKCQNLMSGDEVWAHDGFGKGAVHFADGQLYCLEEGSGTLALVDASTSGWNEKARFTLDPQTELRKRDGRIWTHPVVAGGKLFLRDQELISAYIVKR